MILTISLFWSALGKTDNNTQCIQIKPSKKYIFFKFGLSLEKATIQDKLINVFKFAFNINEGILQFNNQALQKSDL